MIKKRVMITGTGAVASAIARALVPAGYKVSTVSTNNEGLSVFGNFNPEWDRSPEIVEKILKGDLLINPLLDFSKNIKEVPHYQCDLSSKESWKANPFEGADSVIMTAANSESSQSRESAEKNHEIDRHTIDAALSTGVQQIIFTASLWRTSRLVEKPGVGNDFLIKPEIEGSVPEGSHYGHAKEKSVVYLRKVAEKHRDKMFVYIDLGWHPRQTQGMPISNVDARTMQWWIAEAELQQHYLLALNIRDKPFFAEKIMRGENCFAFNGFSNNQAPIGLGHPAFAYDLEDSKKLGVKHEFNVYSVLKNGDSRWRRIPVLDK